MKVLLFAGGAGKRFWPLGRKSLPKQFIRMFNGRSTFELTVERLLSYVAPEDIYVFTHENYKKLAYDHGKKIPKSNFYFEPARRDVGPAVGYACTVMESLGYADEVVAVMWADHVVTQQDEFVKTLEKAERIIIENVSKGVLVGIVPEYAATNLGWIKVEKTDTEGVFRLDGFVYRPDIQVAEELYSQKTGLWNSGYLVSTPRYLLSYYRQFYPSLAEKLDEIKNTVHKNNERFKTLYASLEKVHFDHIVYYNLDPREVVVLQADFGWLDIGSFRALKQYYEKFEKVARRANIIKGLAQVVDSKDVLVVNTEEEKLVVALGIEDITIVNTKDVVLVVGNKNTKKVREVFKELEAHQDLQKYVE